MSRLTQDVDNLSSITSGRSSARTDTLDDNVRDNALLRRVATKDTQAFDELYRHYKPRIERYLSRYLDSPEAVEESYHDVMLVVWKKAGQFQPTSKVSTWIFGIARNIARRACAIRRLDSLPLAPAEEFDDNTPEMALDLQEQRDILAQAIVALPWTLRAPIIWSYYYDYSCAQISLRMNCSETTVKVRLRQARRCLRATLRPAIYRINRVV